MKIKKVREGASLPNYGTVNSAGADLRACIPDCMVIEPHKTVMVPTGLAMAIPEGYVGLIFARSGLAAKRHLAPANKVGVIDADYRGEVMVALHNHSEESQEIAPDERIAQIVIVPYVKAEFEETDSLDETERGEGGFGSTGRK